MSTGSDDSAATELSVEQRLAKIESELGEMRRDKKQLEESHRQKAQRIEELEGQLKREREARKELIDSPHMDIEKAELGDVFIAGSPAGSWVQSLWSGQNTIEDRFEEVLEDLEGERTKRGEEDAYLQKQLAALAEKAGVDLVDSDIIGDDKVQRVLKHGPEDVVDRVSEKHERAATLLRNIGDWGTFASDTYGRRFVINSADARQHLKDKRGESLQSSQMTRVFETIRDWAADSPRHVEIKDKSPKQLRLQLEEN